MSLFNWHIGRGEARENGKTGPRPLRLVGNFLTMLQSPVSTRSTHEESRMGACGLVLRFRGFTAYQCVRADVGSLSQCPNMVMKRSFHDVMYDVSMTWNLPIGWY